MDAGIVHNTDGMDAGMAAGMYAGMAAGMDAGMDAGMAAGMDAGRSDRGPVLRRWARRQARQLPARG